MSASRPDPLWTIHRTLTARGFTFERPPATYRGPISVHGQSATVEIEITDFAFARLPIVRLIDHNGLSPHVLAHITDRQTICYVGEAGLPLDLYDPGGSILRVLVECEAALERSYGGQADAEFEAELASYWQGGAVHFAIPRMNTPAIHAAEMIAQRREAGSGTVIIPRGAWRNRPNGLRIPATVIEVGTRLRNAPNFPASSLATAIDYVKVQRALPLGWRDAILAAAEQSEPMFLAAPNAIIGWTTNLSGRLKMLRGRRRGFRPGFFRSVMEKTLEEISLDRLTGIETDLRFTVERNLDGTAGLIDRKVMLVGCGTIGGYLARMLAQTGAGCGSALTLFDTDELKPGNLGRHMLNFDDLGRPKAIAVADRLRAFHPDLQVSAKVADAVANWSTLEAADLIVDATGDPNVSTALNDRLLHSLRETPPALLHSWVFGNGVAVQSFLNLRDGLACYRCLKTSFAGQWRYNPLKDVNSPLRQAPARCGEAGYVPFAVDAPVSAASLTLAAALDWARDAPGFRLRTAIVDHAAGKERMPWVSPPRLERCDACGR